jgi:hypothetical protein
MVIEWGLPDEDNIKSHPSDFEKLKASLAWMDIETFIRDRIKLATKELVTAESWETARKLQAEIQSLHLLLILPDKMIEWSSQQTGENQDG